MHVGARPPAITQQHHATAHAAAAAAARAATPNRSARPVQRAVRPQRRARSSRQHALAVSARQQQQQQQQLWDYPGSRVTPASLLTVQTLQRRSFGHRNLRTYVVVVADPRSAACRAVESPLESLASGLAHERGAAVLSLDASLPANAAFASRILGVGALPAVLVYPEAAPGFLAYRGADMTAEGLLRAINSARLRALPGSRPYELRHSVAPLERALEGLEQQQQQQQGQQQGQQQQQQEPAFLTPTPLVVPRASGYWGPGKAALWGLLLGAATLAWAWDAFLEDRVEAWRLARRLRQRREGRRRFTLQENLDDILELLLAAGARDLEREVTRSSADEQQLGWRRLDDLGRAGPVVGGGVGGAPSGAVAGEQGGGTFVSAGPGRPGPGAAAVPDGPVVEVAAGTAGVWQAPIDDADTAEASSGPQPSPT